MIGPRVSPKVAKRAVTPELGVMMESRFDAENSAENQPQGVYGQALLAAN